MLNRLNVPFLGAFMNCYECYNNYREGHYSSKYFRRAMRELNSSLDSESNTDVRELLKEAIETCKSCHCRSPEIVNPVKENLSKFIIN